MEPRKVEFVRKVLGFVGVFITGTLLGYTLCSYHHQGTPVEQSAVPPQGILASGSGLNVVQYENARKRLEVAAGLFFSDSWGCRWLTGGVEVEHSAPQSTAVVRVSAFSALVAPGATALAGNVEVEDGQVRALGDALVASGGSYRLRGTPARAWTPTGEVFAGEISFSVDDGTASGSGGVTAVLPAVDAGPAARVQSEGFTARDGVVSFYGSAVAWSGPDLLEAPVIEVSDGVVSGLGGARARRKGFGSVAALEITRTEDLLTFTGSVLGKDAVGREVRCEFLSVSLGIDGEPLEGTCRGGASLDGPGESASADVIDYDYAGSAVTLTGWSSPAELRQGGALVRAGRIRYDAASGRVEAGVAP